MKVVSYCFYVFLFMCLYSCGYSHKVAPDEALLPEEGQKREYYQLKTYTFETEEQMMMTDKYLKSALIPALHRQRINKVGVFKQHLKGHEGVDITDLKTFVLIPMKKMEQAVTIEHGLTTDQSYLTAGSEYINAPFDEPPYARIETVLMRAFEGMPSMAETSLDGPKAKRVYELRSYESPTEAGYLSKVDMFNAGGEIELFDRLGCNAVFYGEVIAGPQMPNLIYMTTYKDLSTRDKKWIAFFDSPEWKELLTIDKYKQTVSSADIHLLYPTDYSDY